MAYQAGDTILDDHYNIFVQGGASAVDHGTANVNTVWGSGTSDKGYGQSGGLSTVSAGSTITATQWVNLLNRCSTIANHQGSSITAITNPSTGDTIAAYTALSGNISTVFNNRLNCAASGTDITTGGSRTGTNTWYTSQQTVFTVTFSSADHARYFFNGGGRIALSFSRSGGTASSKNTGWTNLCSACGTLYFTGGSGTATIAGGSYSGTTKSGGSGSTTTLESAYGWHDYTGTYATIFKQFDATYLYTANYVQVDTYKSGASIYYRVTFQDNANTSGNPGATQDEPVDGTLAATMVIKPPSTTYISNTWGTPTMSSTAFSGS